MIEIRPATRADVLERLGRVPRTMRAWVAELDGKKVAFCGIAQMDNISELFSYVDDDMLAYKKAILKGAKEAMKHAPGVLVARSDPRFEGKLLRHLGFRLIDRIGNDPSDGWYLWSRSCQA